MAASFLQRIRTAFGLGENWPPEALRECWEEIELYAAFRTSDEAVLKQQQSIRWNDRYMISPVPRMVSRAKANLLFSEPAEYKAAGGDADQARLDFLVAENDLDTEAHRGVVISSSEGEVWGRILVRPDLLDAPIIDLVSRRRVIPEFSGRFLSAATFVCEWPIDSVEVMRLMERYEAGAIFSVLFRGTRIALGQEVPLDSFGPTMGTEPVIYTGIPAPLCAFIPNSIDDDVERGFSDYAGLEQRFYGINRATSIGDTNAQLAGKKRALLDAQYTGPGGQIHDEDIYVRDATEATMGESKPLQMLEYSYDSSQITQWLDHLIDTTLAFGGASPQLVGRNLDGAALSGTALRLKMIHSLLEASGSGRYQDKGYARLLHFAQILDSRSVFDLGFGRAWTKPDEKPTIVRQDGLPTDDLEASAIVANLVGGEAISIEERVIFLHPEWDQERVKEEVKRIKEEAAAATAVPVLPGAPPPVPPTDPNALPAPAAQ